jgi:hypothetical protein
VASRPLRWKGRAKPIKPTSPPIAGRHPAKINWQVHALATSPLEAECNLIERFVKGIATRNEKTARNFLADLLRAWLK